MGHAGAIVSGGEHGRGQERGLRRAGISAATNPSEVAELVAEALGSVNAEEPDTRETRWPN